MQKGKTHTAINPNITLLTSEEIGGNEWFMGQEGMEMNMEEKSANIPCKACKCFQNKWSRISTVNNESDGDVRWRNAGRRPAVLAVISLQAERKTLRAFVRNYMLLVTVMRACNHPIRRSSSAQWCCSAHSWLALVDVQTAAAKAGVGKRFLRSKVQDLKGPDFRRLMSRSQKNQTSSTGCINAVIVNWRPVGRI